MDNEKWAFTFGTDHVDSTGRSLGSVYVVIEGNYGEARDKLVEARGDKWSFQYPASEMKYQEALFGISEVSLEDVTTAKKEVKETHKEIKFLVTIAYSNEDGGPICEKSMTDNLQAAIENERQNGVLTPIYISADWVTTEIEYASELLTD